MRILVLNADYPRFLAWFYRRQAELESASYATQPACLASPISIRKLRRAGPPCSGDSRQQSMAPGRLGTRTRHGVRSPRVALSAARRLQPRLYRRGSPNSPVAPTSFFSGPEDRQARAGSNWVDRFRSVRLQKPRVVRLAEHLEMLNHECKQGREFGLTELERDSACTARASSWREAGEHGSIR
jgi:hypothetical protein